MPSPTLYGYDLPRLADAMLTAYQHGQSDRAKHAELAGAAIAGDRDAAHTILTREAQDARQAVEFSKRFQPDSIQNEGQVLDLIDLCRINGTWQGTNAAIDRAVAAVDYAIYHQGTFPPSAGQQLEIPQLQEIDRDSFEGPDLRHDWQSWEAFNEKLQSFHLGELERSAAAAAQTPTAAAHAHHAAMAADYPSPARGAVAQRPAASTPNDRAKPPPPAARYSSPGL